MSEAVALGERVLVDPVLDARLARDGIVAVPMVAPEDLREIEAAYWDLVPPGEDGIRLDYLRTDRALVRATRALIDPVWERVVPEVLEHHYPVYSSFVVKHPGADSHLFLHRDLYVDDERRRPTFAMWMPFVDTGPELDNGPLAFVPGSQEIRHGGFGPNATVLFSPYDEHLRSKLEPIAVPAGTALVYDAKMLHASEPNGTDRPRLAIGCLLARRDQPIVQVVATGRRHRRVHEVDRDYFVDHSPADIAEKGMPDRYPVVDEYDEDPEVTAAVLGPTLQAGAVRRTIVPDDLVDLVGDRRPLPVTAGPRPSHDRDLTVGAADLPPAGTTAADVGTRAVGAVGVEELVGRWRPVGALPDTVPDPVVPLRAPRTRDAALVVVDPRARVELTAPRRRGLRHEAVVLECTPVKSGAATPDHLAELDLGSRVPLAAAQPTTLWNEGPGPLVLVVRSTPRIVGS
jgi:hypothetical protein